MNNEKLESQQPTDPRELFQHAINEYSEAFVRDLARTKNIDLVALTLDHVMISVLTRALIHVLQENGVDLNRIYSIAAANLTQQAKSFDRNAIVIPH